MINLNYLYEYAVLAKFCNFSMASEELNLSQSALSKHIKELEDSLGFQLFIRTTRKVALSESGKLLLPYAKQLCQTNEDIQSAIKELRPKNLNNIRILSIPVMAQYNITRVNAIFQKLNPAIHLSVSECEASLIEASLRKGECDAAYIRINSEDHPSFDMIKLFEDNLTVVMHRSHPLSDKAQLEISSLRNDDFLFLGEQSRLNSLCYTLCKNAGFEPNVVYTGNRPENLVDLVVNGMGIAILSRKHAEYYKNSQIACIDITPPVKSDICLVKLKNKPMSSACSSFWSFLQLECQKTTPIWV